MCLLPHRLSSCSNEAPLAAGREPSPGVSALRQGRQDGAKSLSPSAPQAAGESPFTYLAPQVSQVEPARREGELWHIQAQAGLSVVAIMAVDIFFHFFYILTIPSDLKYANRLPDSALGGCAGPREGMGSGPPRKGRPLCSRGVALGRPTARGARHLCEVREQGLPPGNVWGLFTLSCEARLVSDRVPSTCWGLRLISTTGWGPPGAAKAQEVGSGVPMGAIWAAGPPPGPGRVCQKQRARLSASPYIWVSGVGRPVRHPQAVTTRCPQLAWPTQTWCMTG